MQTDVCIRIINGKMNKKFLDHRVFGYTRDNCFGFNRDFIPKCLIAIKQNLLNNFVSFGSSEKKKLINLYYLVVG